MLDRWLSFRGRSVYFQLKALVLLVYFLIAATTIVVAPPASRAENEIGAGIMVLEGDSVVGRYFIITNESRSHWQKVVFEIDGGYQVERDLVQAHEKVTLYVKDFKKKVIRKRRGKSIPKTVSAPLDSPLTRLSIVCSEGVAEEPLAGKLSPR